MCGLYELAIYPQTNTLPGARGPQTVRPPQTQVPCAPRSIGQMAIVRAAISLVGGAVSVARVEPPLPVVGLGIRRLLGQVLDTPGLLDRDAASRNAMEDLTMATMDHLPRARPR